MSSLESNSFWHVRSTLRIALRTSRSPQCGQDSGALPDRVSSAKLQRVTCTCVSGFAPCILHLALCILHFGDHECLVASPLVWSHPMSFSSVNCIHVGIQDQVCIVHFFIFACNLWSADMALWLSDVDCAPARFFCTVHAFCGQEFADKCSGQDVRVAMFLFHSGLSIPTCVLSVVRCDI